MALMMRSHSSARDWQPHSPSSGTYSSSFCSSSVSGTLVPNSSGNVAMPKECQYFTSITSVTSMRKNVYYYRDLPSSGTGSISHGLIFSVSPLSQLRKKQGYDNNDFASALNLTESVSWNCFVIFLSNPSCDLFVQLMNNVIIMQRHYCVIVFLDIVLFAQF